MTSFGDVNIGDKVRLTHKDGNAVEFTVTDRLYSADDRRVSIRDRNSVFGWFGLGGAWSVEVLEPAPKPLPTEPGWYVGSAEPEVLFWHGAGLWSTDKSGEWGDVHVDDIPRDLVRLVPSTAVEEARAEVVKEIVKFLYRHDDRSWDVAANKVDLTFSKSLGGKA